MLEVYVKAEHQRSNDEIISDIMQDLSAQLLYCEESIKRPITIFRLLRDYLILKGFGYIYDKEKQRVMYGLVNCFLDAEVDRAYVWQKSATIKTPVTIGSSVEVVIICAPNDNRDTNVGQNMAKRSEKYDKISGNLGEDINEPIATTWK